MKFDVSVIKNIVYLCSNYGGHKDEVKLRSHIENITLSTHIDDKGNMYLVSTDALIKARLARKLEISDIIPMTLHGDVVNKIMEKYEMFSGHKNENKLIRALIELDLTPYERVSNSQVVLVLTEAFFNMMYQIGRKGE